MDMFINQQKLKDSWDNIWLSLKPEPIVLNTPWGEEWLSEQKAFYKKMGMVVLGLIALLSFYNYFVIDKELHLEPSYLSAIMRFSTGGLAILSFFLYFSKSFANSRFYRIPMVIVTFLAIYFQAMVLVWWPQLNLNIEYVMTFIVIGAFVIQYNLLWTFVYVVVCYIATTPIMLEAGIIPDRIISNVFLTLAFAYMLRADRKKSILAYVLERREKEEIEKRARAEKALLEKELELTGAVQKLLMPKANEIVDKDGRFHLCGFYKSAIQCGGDWWWHNVTGNHLQVIVGDVTGHGAGPAMVTATMSSFMKTLYKPDKPMETLLYELEDNYRGYFKDSPYFMTMSAFQVDLKSNTLEAWFAGALPLYIMSQDGKSSALSNLGMQLGAETQKIGYEKRVLDEGGRIIVMTDGLQETKNQKKGADIGVGQILRIFKRNVALDAKQASQKLLTTVEDLRGEAPQDDDYTCILIDLPALGSKLNVTHDPSSDSSENAVA